MSETTCPTPKKLPFANQKAAKRQLWTLFYKSRQTDRGLLHTYRCPCGKWHVGHIQARTR